MNQMSNENLFAKHLRKLNPEQKSAVQTLEGPVMVIAGPGTGKTEILTLRIANILDQTDLPPDAILALTFTETAAAAMRQRLTAIIGAAAYRVRITTFHGFCNDLIQRYPEYFPRVAGAASMTEVDQIRVMEQVIETSKVRDLRPFGDPQFYVKPALRAIGELKREGLSPEKFNKLILQEKKAFKAIDDLYYESGAHKGKMKGKYQDLQKHLARNGELAILYADYQARLAHEKRYDYSDMVMEAAETLRKNEGLRLMLQEQHQSILVDEHQDTNNAQNSVLESLTSYDNRPNLFIVGDEKQAIFRFQGASLENFLYFKNKFPTAKLIELTSNYRSTQQILDAAAGLMGRGGLISAIRGKKAGKIIRYAASGPEAEAFLVAAQARDAIAAGENPGNLAIIYRENRDAQPLARMLVKLRVPFAIESNDDLLRDPTVRAVRRIIEAVVRFGDPAALMTALQASAFEILPLDIYKLAEAARTQKKNPYEIIASADKIKEINLERPEDLLRVSKLLSAWKRAAANNPALDVLDQIIHESGVLQKALNPSGTGSVDVEALDRLRAFTDHLSGVVASRHDASLADLLEYFQRLRDHGLLIPFSRKGGEDDIDAETTSKVRLMTAHGAKGREFERVYLVNVVDGHWGNRRKIEHLKLPRAVYRRLEHLESGLADAENDDERNLFYVALTRAKRRLVITYSRQSPEGRELLPSQFVTELKPDLIESGDSKPYEKEFRERADLIFYAPARQDSKPDEKKFLNNLFQAQGLSVTALNNYLECPWKYFYLNLIRIPQPPTPAMCYGRAVHAALKQYFDRWTRGDEPDNDFILTGFRRALSGEPLDQRDLDAALAKGKKALPGYLKNPWVKRHRKLLNEFRIQNIPLAEPDSVKLNGILDRLEILDAANQAIVVDYKTGRPKARAQMKRQLVFYNLLLDRFDRGRFKMVSGQIDFVEPDAKGKYHTEAFEITKDEKQELEAQIKAVADEITTLSFWDKTCGGKDCKYCELREAAY